VLVLAVETATESAGVALVDDGGLLAMTATARSRRHVETVAPSIAFVCGRAGVALGDVTALAVDVGPGLFTGLRVGIATVKALALALGVPVVTATSLEVVAAGVAAVAGAGAGDGRLVVPVVDARRGEVFSAVFAVEGSTTRQVVDDGVGAPGDLADTLRALGRPCIVAGDGALRYGALFASVPNVDVAGDVPAHPPVAVLGTMAAARLAVRARAGDEAYDGDGGILTGAAVTARYLRDADARIHWEQRAERPSGLSPVGGERST